MNDKLNKLNEINNLFKSGVINTDEFNKLKSEILNENDTSNSSSTNNHFKNTNENNTPKRVYLKEFNDSKGQYYPAPEVDYIDINNLTDDETIKLRRFIELKQIHAEAYMTKDEIEIRNKLFSIQNIHEINSKREGFNFALFSIGSVVSSLVLLYIISISPCMMYLGGITFSMYTVISSFFVFSRVAATKYDKVAAAISIIILVIAWVYYGITWHEAFK